jgi:hypothetical protein
LFITGSAFVIYLRPLPLLPLLEEPPPPPELPEDLTAGELLPAEERLGE